MTQLERLQVRIPEETNDAVLEDLLESAKSIYLNLRYPYGNFPTKRVEDYKGNVEEETFVEPRYLDWQIRAAIELYARSGMEGEVSHSENGTSRSYESAMLSSTLRNEIVPIVKAVG